MEPDTEQLVRRGMLIVRGMLAGDTIGWNNALEWAATWIELYTNTEPDPRVAEFGRNMAMSIRANKRK